MFLKFEYRNRKGKDMKKITVIFLGGARRVTLGEQIRDIFLENDFEVSFISVERDEEFYPISSLAKVVKGPSFKEAEFPNWLEELYFSVEHGIIIPCMDAAIPAVAMLAEKCPGLVISSFEGSKIALNKFETAKFSLEHSILHPSIFKCTDSYEGKVIVKPIEGFGAKGISYFDRLTDVPKEFFQTHIVQQFVRGEEVTHDLYVTADGRYECSSRDRLSVIDGEVDHCIVRKSSINEKAMFSKIVQTNLFRGPITVQTIENDGKIFLIEVNARFGGGVTASIAAGFPGIEKLVEEYFNVKLKERVRYSMLEMKRARRDFYRLIGE